MTPQQIIDTVCDYFGITPEYITTKCRKREYIIPRHLCMYFLYNSTILSLQDIGKLLGGYDHSTVLPALKNCENAVFTKDREFYEPLMHLKAIIGISESKRIKIENKLLRRQVSKLQRAANKKQLVDFNAKTETIYKKVV